MTDFLTPAGRSERMARIRSSNTSPEIALRKELHAMGLRFRLGGRGLPGRPDLVLPRYRSVILVHGCFWHRHAACPIATTPKSNTQFWVDKFKRNVARDIRVSAELLQMGWRVVVVWECELNTATKARASAGRVAAELQSSQHHFH
jgi:DNA mismatch endonuclease (patch repair protein)